jgi:uncharacterized protein (TIGR01319 family)
MPARLARPDLAYQLFLAGNAVVREEVCAVLAGGGVTVVATDNVLPDIGLLDPMPARAAIRGVFLEHVIGGKGLSCDPDFAGLVRAVTSDAVLDGVAVLAQLVGNKQAGGASSGSE